ncbi:MAG: sulfotransferase family protein, partial [Candidatus Brocadiales bacterium]
MHHSVISTSTKVRDNLIKLPNFLIVGASRSGTTSLYNYLKQHPEVYMSPVKEPRFVIGQQSTKFSYKGIGDEKSEKGVIKTIDEYKKLFENVRDEKAIGEASVINLYFYEDAIKLIKKYLGDAKIIIILRNPVERAFSQYLRLRREYRESLSFEDGLKMEEKRLKDGWLPGWHYTRRGFYYNSVKAYMEN